MKRMIRNLFSNVLLLILLTCFTIKANGSKNQLLQVYDQNNNAIQFHSDSTYLIIIKNNKSCLNCFLVVEDFIRTLPVDTIHDWLAVSCDSSTLARRRVIAENKRLLSRMHSIGVYYHGVDENSYTPQLLLIKNGESHLFKYDELFDGTSEEIQFTTQKKIKELLLSP